MSMLKDTGVRRVSDLIDQDTGEWSYFKKILGSGEDLVPETFLSPDADAIVQCLVQGREVMTYGFGLLSRQGYTLLDQLIKCLLTTSAWKMKMQNHQATMGICGLFYGS